MKRFLSWCLLLAMSVVGGLLGLLIASVDSFLPQLFHQLQFVGVLIISSNVAQVMLIVFLTSFCTVLLSSFLFERFLRASFVKSAVLASLPILFCVIVVILFRGELLGAFSNLFFVFCAACSAGLSLISLKPKHTSRRYFRIIGLGVLVISSVLLLFTVAHPIARALTSLRSFPESSDFQTRKMWIDNFLNSNPSIRNAAAFQNLISPFAFASHGLHTIVIDWMDGPKVSATLEFEDGTKKKICEWSPEVCLYAD